MEENLINGYKTSALIKAKKSPTIQTLEQEKRENIEKQVAYMKKNLETMYPEQEELVSRLLQQEAIEADFGSSTIDITDTSKVKTLEEFINDSLEKDRQVAVEVGESLRELIETAPEEDVKKIKDQAEEQSVEEFARQSVEQETVEESYEIPDPDDLPEQEEFSKEKEFIEPKYFVIQVGDEEEQKHIVIDKDGNEVGIIKDGQFEISDDYFNSQLEKYNIDDLISSKVRNFEELQRVRQEIKPKSIEQLADMDFDSGKEMMDRADEAIEEVGKEDFSKEDEQNDLEKIEEDELKKENEQDDTFEELDELTKEGDSGKVQNYLDQNSARKLTILIPYTLTDQLDNHGLKERGEEITVYQLKGTVKPKFVLQQGERILYGEGYNEQIQKNMSKIPYSSGVVKEVSDTETTAEVKLIDGTEHEFLVKGQERDLNQSQKEMVIAIIEDLSAELNRINSITPDDMIDYKIEFPGGPEEKCNRIDYLEMEIYKTCSQYGIVPPAEIKAKAVNETEEKDLSEEEQEQIDNGEERTRYGEAENNRWGSNS